MAATESNPTNGNSDAGAEVSPLEKQIIEQIEYYFSDINLARDKFLQGEIKKEDGWVDLTTMLKFARLAKITTEAKVIVDALKKSTNKLMEVNEDGTKIRRNPENGLPTFDNEFVKELIAQSLYLKFIPLDATLDDVKEFFKKNTDENTKINNIIMRYYQDKLANQKKFKGSIFVTFDSKESAEKFLNENKDKELKFNENCEKSLLIKWQQEYHEEKKQEVRSKRDKNRKHEGDGSEDVKEEKKVLLELPKGALLKVTNVKEPLSREDIREVLEKVKTEDEEELIIDFIEFQQGDVTAYIRYKKENQAEAALKALGSGELEVKEVKLNVEVISGEEEQTVLDRMKIDIFKRRQKLMNEKKGGRKFGKKGPRGHKRGSRGGNSDHQNKRVKVE
uniref:La protein homolog n=1 Tax=Cacopsylla melanoneura TaxID=428564 RepID=A0A8D8W8C2_9HEMI